MKKLPIGLYTFSKLIEEDYLYVDKTRNIYQLIDRGGKYYFISRPRRFGKSLLISTLKELFSGNKKLFKDLWIYDKMEWKSYPVIHIDFTNLNYETPEQLKYSLAKRIDETSLENGVEPAAETDYKLKFVETIRRLHKKQEVVILVDEYDKPIIDCIEHKEIARTNREILKNFYSAIKGSDQYIKFVLLTGVSKFSRVSVFSGLNNLNDITMDEQYATMLGYTEEELSDYFPVNDANGERLKQIMEWYNGYSWDGKNFVYNPYSILLHFEKNAFDNYWFDTGTPAFLVTFIKERNFPIENFENIKANRLIFESFDIDSMEITSLLFQTGYLTIKKKTVTYDDTVYYLSYPNKEVRESFFYHLLKGFSDKDFVESWKYLEQLKSALREDRVEDFFTIIKSFFAAIPYNMFVSDREGYYHSIIYLLLRLSGSVVQPEKETNIGRIDAVAETDHTIYIMELKIGTAKEAIAQIKEKKYYEPYLNCGKSVKLLGIGIDSSIRNIKDYLLVQL
jgi:hypothetical protein